MKTYSKHKKVFYVPGMISLVLIPFACIGFLFLNKEFKSEYSMDAIYASQKDIAAIKERFGQFPISRQYKTFNFDKPSASDASGLKELRSELRQLQVGEDSINGIKIHFGPQSEYGTYIAALDRIALERINFYVIYGNDIWVVFIPAKKAKSYLRFNEYSCGGAIRDHDAIEKEKNRELIILYKKNWQIFAGLTAIAFLNIFALIKWNRHKSYSQKSYI